MTGAPAPSLFDPDDDDGADADRSAPVAAASVSGASSADGSGSGRELPSGPVTVYTDGACSGNPGPGGWAWAVAPEGDVFGSGGERTTTNQRMEIFAVLDALRQLTPDGGGGVVTVVSDSTYVVNCFRDGWWRKWERNGWKNSQRKDVANVDLWKPLIELVKRNDVTFRWVKGHSGDRLNDLVDRLAVAAITR